MTKEQKIDMFAMRLDGYTLAAIGEKYGVTRERVGQIISRSAAIRSADFDSIVYPGIRRYCIENDVTLHQLTKTLAEQTSRQANGWRAKLTEKRTSMSFESISAILQVTGLTYEQAFMRE